MASKRAAQAAASTTQLIRAWLGDAPSKWFRKRPAVDQTTDEEAVEAIAWALSALALGIPVATVLEKQVVAEELIYGQGRSGPRAAMKERVQATIKGEPAPVVLPREEFPSILRRHPDVLYSWRVQEMLQAVLCGIGMNGQEPSTKAERRAVVRALEAGQRRDLTKLRRATYIAQEVRARQEAGATEAAAVASVANAEHMTVGMVRKRRQEARRWAGAFRHPPDLERGRRSKN